MRLWSDQHKAHPTIIVIVEKVLRKQMVYDMIVNDAMEQMLSDKPERPVHRTQGTLQIGPSRSFIMVHIRVGVVQIRYCDEPIVHP
jgi:hypothetical protein